MEDSYVKIMKCRFCGGETNALALNRRLKPIEGNVFDTEPCEACQKRFEEGMRFFIGDCGHQGFIKYEALKRMLNKQAIELLGDKKIFKLEKCFACMGIIKLEDCPRIGGEK
jgi:hypothetical protein